MFAPSSDLAGYRSALRNRVPSPGHPPPMYPGTAFGDHPPALPNLYPPSEMGYRSSSLDRHGDTRRYLENQYYLQKAGPMYQTLPSKRTQHLLKDQHHQERSVTPDITRGLERNFTSLGIRDRTVQVAHRQRIVTPIPQYANQQYIADGALLNLKLGIPVPVPHVGSLGRPDVPSPEYQHANQYHPANQYQQANLYQQANQYQQVNQYQPSNQYQHVNHYEQMDQTYTPTCISPPMTNRYSPARNPSPYKGQDQTDSTGEPLKISPIDPRSIGSFQSSTPSSKGPEMKAAANLDSKLLSPKKSSMSSDELYAVIHKSKKKMNIETEADKPPSPAPTNVDRDKVARENTKSPETGYLGDKTRSRFSWSPTKGKNLDFNSPPPGEARSRMSWACNDRKPPQQTSRLDFKKLLLQKSSVLSPPAKKLSAVEQLKMSKQQGQPIKANQHQQQQQQQPEMSILELSGSPRSLVNRKFAREPPTSPKHSTDKAKPAPKLMSPRSQWRFANPRTDVLSSTILEDCREDESPNNSYEKKKRSPQNTNIDVQNVTVSPQNTPVSKDTTDNIKEDPQSIKVGVQTFRNKDTCVNVEKQKSSAAPDTGTKTYTSISQRIQAQRAQFFGSGSPVNPAPRDGYTSQFSSQKLDSKAVSKQAALETAF